jgi:phospholipid/cholesterol/gamma-HCH transport system permease protein
MAQTFIHRLGAWGLDWARTYRHMARLLALSALAAGRLAFLNRAVLRVLVRQLHFVTVQALPVLVLAALALGSITVFLLLSLLTSLGAYDQIGTYLTRAMCNELAPVTTALLLLLRSGPAVTSELAFMGVNGELETLRMLRIPVDRYVYMPRVLAFSIAGPSLALIFAFVGLVGGFFVLGFGQDITFDNYVDQIVHAVEVENLAVLLSKPLVMCLGVCLVSMAQGAQGLETGGSFAQVPHRLIQGMMHSVGLLVAVEILYLSLGA